MAQYKTPGVYVVEENAFPNSVVEVPTAIPVFIGYTETAKAGKTDLTNVPTKIGSFAEFQQVFGGAPAMTVDEDKKTSTLTCTTPFLMYSGLRFFYDNGGGDCYIVSVGGYTDSSGKPVTPDKTAITDALAPLKATPEPTMVITPDTAKMSIGDWSSVAQKVLRHCETMQSRIAILDLVNGNLKFGQPGATDPVEDFYNNVGTNGLNYGAAYYPWVNTNLIEMGDITFMNLSDTVKKALQKEVEAEAGSNAKLKSLAGQITSTKTAAEAKSPHQALMSASQAYNQTMLAALAAMNVMPPSTAMAGIISFTDNQIGPWKAPANTSMTDVLSPTVEITWEDQESLNVPLNGLAINAIRTFINRGVLVWGARTLDGNSQDWRYISVRRTMILIEQSAKLACEAFVFEANDANTWSVVKAMLENFLTNMWRQGALAGTKPTDAFSVSVGLGSTMTPTDILNGIMNVTILVAVTHPAEFIVLTFKQQMQKS
ncbi:phage tail sheath family protein [Vannielia litorea]|uniref:phage tail sheath family protein n=1 Tax=Vannielia litorea TaxID=1217970 RepID=UPI001BD16E92|nr:phage tail sheath C-terminal domain-containing protein [Vannielia litorea]MBS8226349.1 phage tail sheath family protein [Vannielia litorea]